MVDPLAWALAAMLPALGGCDAPRIDYQWTATGYSLADVSYGADHRDLRVDVRNPPSTKSPDAFAAAVAAAMPTAIGVATRFTATPDASARPLYRVVWDFAPTAGQLGREICIAPPATSGAAPALALGDPVPGGVYAVLCRGPSTLSGAYGRLPRGAASPDPDDPAVRALIHDMTLALFPPSSGSRTGY
jgi:hypothetical protein